MARKQRTIKGTETYDYPSRFGSHSSMVNYSKTASAYELTNDESIIVCTDEFGDYVTKRRFLDSGLADPNRYSGFRPSGGSTSISTANFEKSRNESLTKILGSN